MELLKKLTQINTPSGNEEDIRDLIKNEISQYVDEVYTDIIGNLIAHKKGAGKKLILAAHMDEIGIVITFIDDKGFLRFSNVGGLSVSELAHRKVIFKNGVVGVIGSEEEEFKKKASLSKLYIDIGAASKTEAEKRVSVGDMAAFIGGFYTDGSSVVSKALDNRAGCYVLLESAKNIGSSDNDIYFVFTVQEEVGLRGAKTAAFGIDADFALAIDVTDTGDTPSAPFMAVEMGKGAAVKVMDRSVLCHHEVREKLIEIAKKENIPYQLEIMTDGGTDAGAIHLTGNGVKTGGVSIPSRYIHSPAEMASVADINACIKLVSAYAESKL